jgi:two-component system, OmpR family, KDP operon response regulator KdpE
MAPTSRAADVLVCDDEDSIRRLYRRVLADADAWVREAATAEECLAQVGDKAPDLLILDAGLPDRNGVEILPELRAKCPDTRIVMVSGGVTDQVRESALARGADDCVQKTDFVPLLVPLVASCRGAA